MVKRCYTLGEVLAIQEELNHSFVHEKWRDEISTDMVDVQIIDECSELFGSGLKYKWWGKPKVDFDLNNVMIETVDVMHFLATKLLLLYPDWSMTQKWISEEIGMLSSNPEICFIDYGKAEIDHKRFMKIFKEMLNNQSCSFLTMFAWIGGIGLNPVTLSGYYSAKVELNRIRNNEGNLVGKYEKVVDGIEDNVKLYSVVDEFCLDESICLSDIKTMVFEKFYDKTDK